MTWLRFNFVLLFSALFFGLGLFAFIVALDPYQNVPFSPDLPRAPVSQNQRYAYPAIARDPQFDSVVVGSSTARLLNPLRLDALLEARFANLAMNSATAYEQLQIARLFSTHHDPMRYFVLGIDDSWCRREAHYRKYTFRSFPEWLFDNNRWNDLLYLFNDKALENAVRMWELLHGRREPKYARNGYKDFTRDFGAYDPNVVRTRLYPDTSGSPQNHTAFTVTPEFNHTEWRYANVSLLTPLVASIEERDALLLVVFPPYHAFHLSKNAASYRECKARVLNQLRARKKIVILDYMLDSDLTRNDNNFWDPLHYTDAVAQDIERDLAAVAQGEILAKDNVVVRVFADDKNRYALP